MIDLMERFSRRLLTKWLSFKQDKNFWNNKLVISSIKTPSFSTSPAIQELLEKE